MSLPFVIDNRKHRLGDALKELPAHTAAKPLDIAMAYFAISGYRLVKEGLHQVGAFRLMEVKLLLSDYSEWGASA